MPKIASAGAAFLLAVLWFDMMFDMQTRSHGGEVLPPEVLTSISAYYRRVTTDAYPMNRLVALVMLITLAAVVGEIVQGKSPWWISWVSLALIGVGATLTLTGTVPNAVRLGSATDTPEVMSSLARSIFRDHQFAFARTLVLLVLQLVAK